MEEGLENGDEKERLECEKHRRFVQGLIAKLKETLKVSQEKLSEAVRRGRSQEAPTGKGVTASPGQEAFQMSMNPYGLVIVTSPSHVGEDSEKRGCCNESCTVEAVIAKQITYKVELKEHPLEGDFHSK